jgi:hypothetical protein
MLFWVVCYFGSEFRDFCYSSWQKYSMVYWIVCYFGSRLYIKNLAILRIGLYILNILNLGHFTFQFLTFKHFSISSVTTTVTQTLRQQTFWTFKALLTFTLLQPRLLHVQRFQISIFPNFVIFAPPTSKTLIILNFNTSAFHIFTFWHCKT